MVLISKHWSQSHISNTTAQNCCKGIYMPPMKYGQSFLSQTNTPLSFSVNNTLIHSSCIKQESWVFLNASLHLFTLSITTKSPTCLLNTITLAQATISAPAPQMVFLLLLLLSQRCPPHSTPTLPTFALATLLTHWLEFIFTYYPDLPGWFFSACYNSPDTCALTTLRI